MYMKILIFTVFLVIVSWKMQEVDGRKQVACSNDEDCIGRIACGETPVICLDHICECVIIGRKAAFGTHHHSQFQYMPCAKDNDCSLLHCNNPENGDNTKCVDQKCACNS